MQLQARTMRATLLAAQQADAFAEWLRADGDRLVAAAALLGGAKWKARAEAVIDAVSRGRRADELVEQIHELHRLLSLEYVDDLDSAEAALFLLIDPDDPCADDARLCQEALERGLEAVAIVAAAGLSDRDAA